MPGSVHVHEKQELGLVSGQFNGPAAEGREQTWVELLATVFWLLWALRACERKCKSDPFRKMKTDPPRWVGVPSEVILK